MKLTDAQRVLDASQALAGAKATLRRRREALVVTAMKTEVLDAVHRRLATGLDHDAQVTAGREAEHAARELNERLRAVAEAVLEVERREKTWRALK